MLNFNLLEVSRILDHLLDLCLLPLEHFVSHHQLDLPALGEVLVDQGHGLVEGGGVGQAEGAQLLRLQLGEELVLGEEGITRE